MNCFYLVGEIRNAVECVETFLLIEPNDTNMVSNKLYYQVSCRCIGGPWYFLVQKANSIKQLFFNTVLRGHVACIKSSLLLKIQWKEHYYLDEHGCYSVQDFYSRDHNDTESGSTGRESGGDCYQSDRRTLRLRKSSTDNFVLNFWRPLGWFLNHFQTQEKADISWFKARPEVEKYLLRDRYEKDILSFIYTQFAYYNKNGDDGPKLQNKDDLKAFKVWFFFAMKKNCFRKKRYPVLPPFVSTINWQTWESSNLESLPKTNLAPNQSRS